MTLDILRPQGGRGTPGGGAREPQETVRNGTSSCVYAHRADVEWTFVEFTVVLFDVRPNELKKTVERILLIRTGGY